MAEILGLAKLVAQLRNLAAKSMKEDNVRLNYMHPRYSVDNRLYSFCTDSKIMSYSSCSINATTFFVSEPNVSHEIVSQFCHAASFSCCRIVRTDTSMSSFGVHIIHVGLMGVGEQVRRIDTRGIVATVENIETVWYCSVMNLPREAMCFYKYVIYPNGSIVLRVVTSGPYPALAMDWMNWTIFVHFSPESDDGIIWIVCGTVSDNPHVVHGAKFTTLNWAKAILDGASRSDWWNQRHSSSSLEDLKRIKRQSSKVLPFQTVALAA